MTKRGYSEQFKTYRNPLYEYVIWEASMEQVLLLTGEQSFDTEDLKWLLDLTDKLTAVYDKKNGGK